jgi:ParB-like nuclease domain.
MVIARKKRSERLYILNGVRRAVAVREAGKKTIQATIHRAGKSPVSRRIALDRLFSPKARVELDARFYRILLPLRTPIEVEPLGLPSQDPSVPLAEVELV